MGPKCVILDGMKNPMLKITDPIRVFELVTRFVNKVETLSMSEEQYFVTLPTIVADLGKS